MAKFFSRLLVCQLFLVISLISSPTVRAEGEFSTSSSVSYSVAVDGTTIVTHDIVLTNKLSAVYATGYTLTLDGYLPKTVEAWDSKGFLTTSVDPQGTGAKVNLTFNDQVVGTGGRLNFSIRYPQDNIASRKGQIWEITIPRQTDSLSADKYVVSLTVPISFGKAAYISPLPEKSVTSGDSQIFIFQKDQIEKSRIVAAFGNFQNFDFVLSYHLQNQENSPKKDLIALPPDTPYQRVSFDSIDPQPLNVVQDADGNWLASFNLVQNADITVTVKGSTQIFATPQKQQILTSADSEKYLSPSEMWQTNDPKINSLANNLKTPRAIYDYVVGNLTYNLNRVKPGTKRLGAKAALENPKSAICTEFTDLFIALSRAAGIPAREIEGFAYTVDPQLEPLSLVEDVLHAWPEYWDKNQSTWVEVDPTWGNTTGGVDFFTKLDLNHFAFVIHGLDPFLPLPAGSYRQGIDQPHSVAVSFGEYHPNIQISLKASLSPGSVLQVPFTWQTGTLKLTNMTGASQTNLNLLSGPSIRFPHLLEPLQIPPFGNITLPVEYKLPLLLPWNKDPELTVAINSSKITLSLPKKNILEVQMISLTIYGVVVGFVLTCVLILKKR